MAAAKSLTQQDSLWNDSKIQDRFRSSFAGLWNKTPTTEFPLDAIQLFIRWHCCNFKWNLKFADNLVQARELDGTLAPVEVPKNVRSAVVNNPFASGWVPHNNETVAVANTASLNQLGAQAVIVEDEDENENGVLPPSSMFKHFLDSLQSTDPDGVAKADVALLHAACVLINPLAQDYTFDSVYSYLSEHEESSSQPGGKDDRRRLLEAMWGENFDRLATHEEVQCLIFYYHLTRKDSSLLSLDRLAISDYWQHHIKYAAHSGADLHSHILRHQLMLERCVEIHLEEKSSHVSEALILLEQPNAGSPLGSEQSHRR